MASPANAPPVDRPLSNRLLTFLPATDMRRLRPHLQPVALDLGTVVYEAGASAKFVYFPTSGIISLLQVMANGSSGEIAVVGNEGVVGIALFMGGESSPSRAVVQSAVSAYRVDAAALMGEFRRGGELQRVLLRYIQTLMAQMAQTAVCNRHHSIHQQLCRWLLMSLDRLPGRKVEMTQELIANMLGVRREGVTDAARALQDMHLISYARGRIEVLDRPGLERSACECYAVVKAESDRLFPNQCPSDPLKMGREDDVRIDVESEQALAYWARTFRVSIAELRAAVAQVGPRVKDVRDHLLI